MIPRTLRDANDELGTAWHAIREMMPDELGKIFLRAALVENFEEGHRIHEEAIDWIIKSALVLMPRSQLEGEQARCPLCKRSSSSPYSRGFAYPEGLYRHLRGSGARKCTIMDAMWDMTKLSVREHVEDKP